MNLSHGDEPVRHFDMVFLGHYTKDTIITPTGTQVVDGGACFHGSAAAAALGLKVAVISRLAAEDEARITSLLRPGITLKAVPTVCSTCLELRYPSGNPDERTLSVTSRAAPFEVEDIEDMAAPIWSIGASIRDEVPLDILNAIKKRKAQIGLDAQGFVRVLRNGNIVYDPVWSEKEAILSLTDVFKADIVEAELLVGTRDLRKAARELAAAGPRELVLTHGDGVLVFAAGEFFEMPFTAGSLLGRSGRGDTCLAAYLSARMTMAPAEATLWAAALTSLKMEAPGPFRGTKEEVLQVIKERYRRHGGETFQLSC